MNYQYDQFIQLLSFYCFLLRSRSSLSVSDTRLMEVNSGCTVLSFLALMAKPSEINSSIVPGTFPFLITTYTMRLATMEIQETTISCMTSSGCSQYLFLCIITSRTIAIEITMAVRYLCKQIVPSFGGFRSRKVVDFFARLERLYPSSSDLRL